MSISGGPVPVNHKPQLPTSTTSGHDYGREVIYIRSIFFKKGWPHPEVYVILVPQSGIQPTPLALEGRVLTSGPLGKSCITSIWHWKHYYFQLLFGGLSRGFCTFLLIYEHKIEKRDLLCPNEGFPKTWNLSFAESRTECSNPEGSP